MPLIDFTQPYYLIAAVVVFVLCIYLGRNQKTNTVPCLMLLVFLAIIAGHTIELTSALSANFVSTLAKNIIIDEAFIFASFLSFLWLDKIQIDANKKKKGKKKAEPTIKDGLDFLWKKV